MIIINPTHNQHPSPKKGCAGYLESSSAILSKFFFLGCNMKYLIQQILVVVNIYIYQSRKSLNFSVSHKVDYHYILLLDM